MLQLVLNYGVRNGLASLLAILDPAAERLFDIRKLAFRLLLLLRLLLLEVLFFMSENLGYSAILN
jgi:hypothetical protein